MVSAIPGLREMTSGGMVSVAVVNDQVLASTALPARSRKLGCMVTWTVVSSGQTLGEATKV